MALPMGMGLGCNAAGITGCRILSPGPARTAAILTNALIPCNGRFPALILLAGMLLGAFGLDSALARAAVLLLTLALFAAVYVFLFVGWARVISGFIKRGPVDDAAASAAGSADEAAAAVKEGE